MAGKTYTIRTDLDPVALNQVGLAIYAAWMEFALGHTELAGRKLVYPTGRYAASISFRQESESVVAIVADEGVAPEAAIIEEGHGAVDLKTKLVHGKLYKMHRKQGATQAGAAQGLRRTGAGPAGLSPRIWGQVRSAEANGYASIGPNSAPDSWIIPPMMAYSPALVLSNMAAKTARDMVK